MLVLSFNGEQVDLIQREDGKKYFVQEFPNTISNSVPAVTRSQEKTAAMHGLSDEMWEMIWQNLTPGDMFDQGVSAPVVASLPTSSALPPGDNLRALIPGCGRGYDVQLLASHPRFAHVTGLEIAPGAVAAARAYLSEQRVPPGRYDVVQGDFFDPSILKGPFDVAFDYTFFCAIDPDRRIAWARAYAARVRPGGVLATLMFPVCKVRLDEGPPYGVSPALYASVLTPAGFECVEGPRVLRNEEAGKGRGDGTSMWALWKRVGDIRS